MARGGWIGLASCVTLLSCGVRDRDRPERVATGAWPEATWAQGGVRVHGEPAYVRPSTFRTRHGALITMPSRAGAVLHVEAAPQRWIEQRALDLDDVVATSDADRLRFVAVAPTVDLVRFATADGFEEVRVLASTGGVHRARYRVGLGQGIDRLRVREGLIEALDAEGRAWLRSPRPLAVDAKGTKREAEVTLERHGSAWDVTVSLATEGLVAPIALDPGWFLTTAMSTHRANFATAKLAGGKVLVTGGDQDGFYTTALSTAEIFDPATKTFTTTASMGTPRTRHAAATLADGTVLVSGGGDCVWCSSKPSTGALLLSTAEIFDGTTWAPAASMSTVRGGHALVTASSKVVLAAGGATQATPALIAKTAEFYDPTTNKWTVTTNNMTDFRTQPAALKMPSGRILVLGGWTFYNSLSSADSYDPATNAFSSAGNMSAGRVLASVGLLDDGSVIVAGGAKDLNSCCGGVAPIATADVLSPTTGVWTTIAGPKTGHTGAASLVLTDATGAPTGKFLVAGGFGNGTNKTSPVLDVDLYDRSTGTWTGYGYLSIGRTNAFAAAIGTTDVAVFGGQIGDYDWTKGYISTASAETTGTALPSSSKCTDNGNCTSGFCVDGRCCNAACTGQCEACDVPGSEGNCVPVNGAVHGGRTPCGGSPECAKTCDGTSTTCTQGKTTTRCGGTTCTGHMVSTGGTCSGDSSNTCNPATATPCPGDFICDTPTACKTTCASDLDCVTGKVCDTSSGKCGAPVPDAGPDTSPVDTGSMDSSTAPDTLATFDGSPTTIPAKPTVGSFQRCVHDADCPTKHCVDGVCCDTACTDRCHSCALLSAPGICTLEPAGVDLRNDCGAAESCTGTCGAAGECIGAGAGSMCARNKCTGPSVGVGPAYCSAPGAVCSNADVVPFDCSPYACAPAFGACLTACVDSTDCANGFVCDVGSKTCVSAAPPPDDGGGCSSTSRGAPSTSILLLAAAVGTIARVRRRVSGRRWSPRSPSSRAPGRW